MDLIVKTENLSAGYGGEPAVSKLNISIKRGQVLTLIGPNGAGKSTLLKAIAKQLSPLGGTVYIEGKDIKDINRKELAQKAALMLTGRPKLELLNCFDVASMGRYPYTGMLGILSQHDKDVIDDALKTVGAYDLKYRGINEISDGQLQRVMLARAICQEPEIIILDEPASFLDIRCAVDILEILKAMACNKKVTVIMSLHELNFAKLVSDIVVCIKDGEILYTGTPEEIFKKDIINHVYDLPEGYYEKLFR